MTLIHITRSKIDATTHTEVKVDARAAIAVLALLALVLGLT